MSKASHILIRISAEDKETIRAAAERVGLTMSAFIFNASMSVATNSVNTLHRTVTVNTQTVDTDARETNPRNGVQANYATGKPPAQPKLSRLCQRCSRLGVPACEQCRSTPTAAVAPAGHSCPSPSVEEPEASASPEPLSPSPDKPD